MSVARVSFETILSLDLSFMRTLPVSRPVLSFSLYPRLFLPTVLLRLLLFLLRPLSFILLAPAFIR